MNSTVHIYPIDGACHRVGADATAFAYRDANFATVIAGMWPDPADNEANIAVGPRLLRGDRTALRGGRLHQLHVRRRPGPHPGQLPDNYDRLVEVKRKYDPGNLFHLNQNIAPWNICSLENIAS